MASSALTLGFDADDTLWHNENIFEKVHERYRALLARYHDAATVDRTLFTTEMRNLERYGYGVKGFMLSSIETAIQLSAGKISAEEIQQLIALGQDMLAHPVDLLDGVVETLSALSGHHRLLVITNGDLRDQERQFPQIRHPPRSGPRRHGRSRTVPHHVGRRARRNAAARQRACLPTQKRPRTPRGPRHVVRLALKPCARGSSY